LLSISQTTITFVLNTKKMSLGIVVIFSYMLLGFWMVIFLGTWIPLMATLLLMERFSPAMGEKLAAMITPRD
jgi:hypothetical protein